MCDGHDHEESRISAAWANLRQPMPLGRKLRLFFRNEWKKVRTGSTCCGNYGEPGC
jgi:hypothetical protein